MSDPREQIRSVIQDLIADNTDSANATMHQILVARTQQVAGLAAATAAPTNGGIEDQSSQGDENA